MILVKTLDENAWQRPSDWPAITNPSANTIKLLVADVTCACYAFKVIVASGGTYSVNWGDGVTDSGIASDALAEHTYTVGAGQTCSRGYTTFVITITATNTITRFYVQNHSMLSNDSYPGYLDAEFGTSGLTTIASLFYATTVNSQLLEHCRFNSALASCVSAANAFEYCASLQSVDVSKLTAVTNGTSMFQGCYKLKSVDVSKMTALTNTTNMFYLCYRLSSVNVTGLSSVTTASTMFQNCTNLVSIDISTMTGIITATSMFELCTALRSITLPNLPSCTGASTMFGSCYGLQYITIGGLGAVTNATTMFLNCYSLQSIDISSMTALTNTTSMFQGCTSLRTVNVTGLTLVATATSMFRDCYNLLTVTGLSTFGSAAASVLGTTMFYNAERIAVLDLSGCKFTKIGAYGTSGKLNKLTSLLFHASSIFSSTAPQITVTYDSFSAAQLDTLFLSLPSMAKTIAITGTTGAVVVSLAGTTVAGSTTVTMANTSGLSTGMEIRGTGISTAVAVTFTDAGDIVTLASHGIADGTVVYFATIVSTTGISTNTPYYVVNGTLNTFQVSLTLGGAPLPLTTDGSGTMTYGTTIQSINPNVSIVISIPASASGSITTESSLMHRSYAIGRGWTVTN